ncbi:MAG: hypothetical protein WAL90_00875 [Desulfobacterales bacterium]
MHEQELVTDILQQIDEAAKTILARFQPVSSAEDFTHSDAGREKLDAICMQLIAIGESLKQIDTITSQSLLRRYPQIGRRPWDSGTSSPTIISMSMLRLSLMYAKQKSNHS